MAPRFGLLSLLPLLAAMYGCNPTPCSLQDSCKYHGLCQRQGMQCVAGSDADCRAGEDCKTEGRCTAKDGDCIAASDKDCQASSECEYYGHCGAEDGVCRPLETYDCKQSKHCKDAGRCFLNGKACADRPEREDTREGCPCGCDHSIEMAAELRSAPDASALAAIDDTLRTIAEREDAGYITDAMVEHRIRMLDLLAELEPPLDDEQPRERGVPLDAEPHVMAVTGDGSSLRVQAELSAHGQTTEIVRGQEKLLRASFRVGLSVENKTDATLTVAAPTIRGSVGMPVSRWYELGGDGRPWDGVLAPNEMKTINLIGYLGEPVEPGTPLQASVTIDSLTLETRTVASAHWAGAQSLGSDR